MSCYQQIAFPNRRNPHYPHIYRVSRGLLPLDTIVLLISMLVMLDCVNPTLVHHHSIMAQYCHSPSRMAVSEHSQPNKFFNNQCQNFVSNPNVNCYILEYVELRDSV